MERSYLSSAESVLAHFGVTQARGLSSKQVEKSREKYGFNG